MIVKIKDILKEMVADSSVTYLANRLDDLFQEEHEALIKTLQKVYDDKATYRSHILVMEEQIARLNKTIAQLTAIGDDEIRNK